VDAVASGEVAAYAFEDAGDATVTLMVPDDDGTTVDLDELGRAGRRL